MITIDHQNRFIHLANSTITFDEADHLFLFLQRRAVDDAFSSFNERYARNLILDMAHRNPDFFNRHAPGNVVMDNVANTLARLIAEHNEKKDE